MKNVSHEALVLQRDFWQLTDQPLHASFPIDTSRGADDVAGPLEKFKLLWRERFRINWANCSQFVTIRIVVRVWWLMVVTKKHLEMFLKNVLRFQKGQIHIWPFSFTNPEIVLPVVASSIELIGCFITPSEKCETDIWYDSYDILTILSRFHYPLRFSAM